MQIAWAFLIVRWRPAPFTPGLSGADDIFLILGQSKPQAEYLDGIKVLSSTNTLRIFQVIGLTLNCLLAPFC